MKVRFCTVACVLAAIATTTHLEGSARAFDRSLARLSQREGNPGNQDRPRSTQFDDHTRQTTRDWYDHQKDHPPAGFRSGDRLSADQESRLQPGKPLDPDLRRRERSVPHDLSRQLPPPPPNHRYVAIGGHVGIEEKATHILRDVIHLHDR
jgi:Ni/Co efflux regulator RcnB